MTNNKFNALFINEVIKPNHKLFINDGYVDRDMVAGAYLTFKRKKLDDRTITQEQSEKFIISHKEITKSKLK